MEHLQLSGLQHQVKLAPFTTFKIGGPAKYFFIAKTPKQVQEAVSAAQQNGLKWFVLGTGSNILVADEGFNGLVIKMEITELQVEPERGQIWAGAGARLSTVILQAAKNNLGGLEFAAGVPATVGGAVWANLGAHGREVKDYVVMVDALNSEGELVKLINQECRFAYRDSIFKHQSYVILGTTFQLERVAQHLILAKVRQHLEQRKTTQAITEKCAGSIFKNPVEQTKLAAAQLIESLGLKGLTIGGAQISSIHANFIVNTGNATARDIVMLISLIKQKVRDQHRVQLMEEIEYVGF